MGMLDGKVAIVTGGGTGIGKAITRAFAAEGCSVVISARNAERLSSAATELQKSATGGAKVVPIAADVTDEKQIQHVFAETMSRFKRLDILVNNAGAFPGGSIETLTLEKWNAVIDVNVTGVFLCTREAFKIMKPAGGGRIINIGSIAAQRPREWSAPYTTSKFAVWGLTNAAALDGRDFNISVSCLHPGNTEVERRASTRSASGKDVGEEPMIGADTIARTALLMVTLPKGATMLEAIVMPITQTYLGRG
jgi:NAD(P)-dependent dehydrogenase (short-subunit alcohol dehydrogenase family)